MADANTTNLCTQIIYSHFGPITAKVSHALLTRGRLSLLQLIQFTALKPRLIRASILILVQHNLAWHVRYDDSGEVVEFNTLECLLRLRFGRFVWQAEMLFGPAAAEIVSLILDHGKLRLSDILSQLCSENSKDASVYSQTLYKLVSSSYLVPSTVLFHVSPRDTAMQYEKEEKSRIKNFPTAKELRQARERAEARLKREQQEALSMGIKRKAVDYNIQRSVKRKAIEENVVNDEVYFRVYAAKFNIHIRDKLIVEATRERYNSAAAAVMKAALKACEPRSSISDCRSDGLALHSIVDYIPKEENIVAGLSYPTSKKTSMMMALREFLGVLSAADNPTSAGRASSFMSFAGSTSGRVFVEFEIVSRRLRRRVFEAIVRQRYGDEAVRIVKLLLANGKMGGDQIAKSAMMAITAVRPLLTSISADSLVSIQEVPKGADRNPQRTIYLWYVDLPKTYSVLLGNFYKMLYNNMMRRRAEAEEFTVKAVLEKSQRSDVSEDPSLLSRTERQILRAWEERRDKLLVLEMRVEEAVFILRDLAEVGKEES